jgi:hypothetical protein
MLYAHYAAHAGPQGDQMARALAFAVCAREQLDVRLTKGELVDPLLLCRLSGEIRRLLARLGIDADHEMIDATEEVIAHLRAQRPEARPGLPRRLPPVCSSRSPPTSGKPMPPALPILQRTSVLRWSPR